LIAVCLVLTLLSLAGAAFSQVEIRSGDDVVKQVSRDDIWGDASVVTITIDVESPNPLGTPIAAYSFPAVYTPPTIFINEFMADNNMSIEDPDDPGDTPGWIELFNAGVDTVDLSGMYLTDDLGNPTQWRIPEGVILGPGEHLIFWTDEEAQGTTHANFQLDRNGGVLGLFDTDANQHAPIDVLLFGEQETDVSFGRSPDTGTVWRFLNLPSPGAANPPSGDINCDALVDYVDLGILISSFGVDRGGDLNGDCETDEADLDILLDNYGNDFQGSDSVKIVFFLADPSRIQPGQQTHLSWRTEYAEYVELEGIGEVLPTGDIFVSPDESTSYRLTARHDEIEASAVVEITVVPPNRPPVAFAGLDQYTSPGIITLDGSASFDPDGDPLDFFWRQVSGPAVVLSNPESAVTTFEAVSGGTYMFYLQVSDGRGGTDADDVRIVIW